MSLLYTAHVPAGPGPFPCIFALHGWGASAHDLLGLAPLLLGGRALLLAPQGPVAVPIAPGHDGHGWFELYGGVQRLDADGLARSGRELEAWTEQARARYPIDPARSLLLGFSQGGVMAYELFLRRPERWAGMAALSSWFPGPQDAAIPPNPAAKGRPIFVAHGTRDDVIPLARARETRARLEERGVALHYSEYEMAHEIAPQVLRDLARWLEEVLAGS
jgi:phospholipase/carboxylesterase